jgi:hypothetical protein
MLTGVIHILLVVMPGVYADQFLVFMNSLFFNINDGLAGFPLFGGVLNHKEFAAFWFFYAGALLFIYGQVLDELEKREGVIPRHISLTFISVSLVGAYMIPLSGMTFLLIPQGIYMYLRNRSVKA